MIKHSKESLNFIRKLREKSLKRGDKTKTDAVLVRAHQRDHGWRIIVTICLLIFSIWNLLDHVEETNWYLRIGVMIYALAWLIYSCIKYQQGQKFRKEWIAHWKCFSKDIKSMSFDELNDMAKWL